MNVLRTLYDIVIVLLVPIIYVYPLLKKQAKKFGVPSGADTVLAVLLVLIIMGQLTRLRDRVFASRSVDEVEEDEE